jgi:hypothetical protein
LFRLWLFRERRRVLNGDLITGNGPMIYSRELASSGLAADPNRSAGRYGLTRRPGTFAAQVLLDYDPHAPQ